MSILFFTRLSNSKQSGFPEVVRVAVLRFRVYPDGCEPPLRVPETHSVSHLRAQRNAFHRRDARPQSRWFAPENLRLRRSPSSSRLFEIVSDDFPRLHAGRDSAFLALHAAMVSRTELFFEHYQINQCGSRQAVHATREEEKELQKRRIRWTLKAKSFCDANYLVLSCGNSASCHE